LELYSPRDSEKRGSHVSLTHVHGWEIMQALISRDVIGDFRAPNILRFGFTPLYTSYVDVWHSVNILHDILDKESWKDPAFSVRALVT